MGKTIQNCRTLKKKLAMQIMRVNCKKDVVYLNQNEIGLLCCTMYQMISFITNKIKSMQLNSDQVYVNTLRA